MAFATPARYRLSQLIVAALKWSFALLVRIDWGLSGSGLASWPLYQRLEAGHDDDDDDDDSQTQKAKITVTQAFASACFRVSLEPPPWTRFLIAAMPEFQQ
ncbi:hypothetical protein BM221_002312 [Beauveria bassiana]|uniref:Uncharacterized protein n=1 Tax=Beauveria bassiana TaxID=176275 RepID=A0A2N6NY65_BEABA|nr:hypothetical protein BM221_002312 [Beauveria bassiana]